MSPWKRALVPGILTVCVLSFASILFNAGALRSDMLARSRAMLDREGHTWAKIEVEGRDLELSGNAPSPEARDLALQAVHRVFGMRDVVDSTTLAPEVAPFVWKLQRRDGKWLVSGFVPTDEARQAVRSAVLAAAPDAEIVDATVLARGLPTSQFLQSSQYVIAVAGRLASGGVGLADRTVWADGQAKSPPDLKAIAALKVPDGVRATVSGIIPPAAVPFSWFARIDQGKVSVSGVAPDDATRASIADDLRRNSLSTTLSDTSTVASGEPAGFREIARFALGRLTDLEVGTAVIADGRMHLSGRAASVAAYRRLMTALDRDVPGVATLGTIDITPPEVFPFVWSAHREPGRVVLSGFVPSAAVRKALGEAAAAQAPGSSIVDRTELAANAPEGFAGHAAFALGQLASLETGTITLFGQSLAIDGQASTIGDVEAISAGLSAGLPAGLAAKSVQLRPAVAVPYALQLHFSPTGVRMAGVVPSQAAAAAAAAGISQRYPGRPLSMRVRLAAGEPDGFNAAVAAAVGMGGELDDGDVVVADRSIHVSGTAASPEAFARLAASVHTAAADGWTVEATDIRPATVAPYTFRATFDGAHIALSGVVPSRAAGQGLVQAAHAVIPYAEVSDMTGIAAGDPAGFADGARYAIARLADLRQGSAIVADGAVHLIGEAGTVSAQRAMATDLASPPAGFTVRTAAIRPPRVADWTFAMARTGSALTLTGYVPDEAVRGRIIAAAAKALPSIQIADRLDLAAGGPDGLAGAAEFGLAQLARLDPATVTIDWNGYSLSARPADYATYQDVMTPLQSDPVPGVRIGRIDLPAPIPSPYVFALQRSGNAVQLTGYVPNAGSRAEVVAAVRRQMGDVRIADQLAVTPGAPEMFAEAVVAGLVGASRLQDGQVGLADTKLSVKGGAYFGSSVKSAQDQIAELLPKGYTADTSAIALLPPPPQVSPAQCELGMRQASRTQPIRFEPAKPILKPESFGVLDEVAFAALRCVDTRIRIEGHTDSDGDEESNIKLSEARAKAVAVYLGRTGVAADRLVVEGFGSSKPVASNDTIEGKWQNRRIEFRVVE